MDDIEAAVFTDTHTRKTPETAVTPPGTAVFICRLAALILAFPLD